MSASWDDLRARMLACDGCRLRSGCQRVVFGDGGPGAVLFVLGEAPGEVEDDEGLPFVGESGRLLRSKLFPAFAQREVFISNTARCRPPSNRDPEPDEVAACAEWTRQQFEHLRPVLALAVGRVAAAHLLGRPDVRPGRVRGLVHDGLFGPVIVTWHPAYALRNRSAEPEIASDIAMARAYVDRRIARG